MSAWFTRKKKPLSSATPATNGLYSVANMTNPMILNAKNTTAIKNLINSYKSKNTRKHANALNRLNTFVQKPFASNYVHKQLPKRNNFRKLSQENQLNLQMNFLNVFKRRLSNVSDPGSLESNNLKGGFFCRRNTRKARANRKGRSRRARRN